MTGRQAERHFITSGVAERNRNKLGAVARLHAHQYRVLASLMKRHQFLAHIVRLGHPLAGNIEDDVARLHAVLGCRPVRVDACHSDALIAGAAHFAGRGQGQTEPRGAVIVVAVILRSARIRSCAPC